MKGIRKNYKKKKKRKLLSRMRFIAKYVCIHKEFVLVREEASSAQI